ncbi:hypothetical protein S245_024417 [Arachis hypogaea]
MHATRVLHIAVAENLSQRPSHVSFPWATRTLRVDRLAGWSPCTRHHASGKLRKGFVEGFKREMGEGFVVGFHFIHTLQITGFYHVSKVGQIRGHFTLVFVLVERWRPKTHSFVLPAGGITVTLENVLHIFGLSIDGEVVNG